jgi:hypothetical protein
MWNIWQNYDLKHSAMAYGRLEKNCKQTLLAAGNPFLSLVVTRTTSIYLRLHTTQKSSKGSIVQGGKEDNQNQFLF